MRIGLPAVLCWAVVAGCAPIQPPQPGAGHPASPQATAAREAKASGVLAVDEKNLPQNPPEMRRGMMHHGQGQTGGETMDADSRETDPAGSFFTCAMHPEVTAEQPGQCPICGMELVAKGEPDDE